MDVFNEHQNIKGITAHTIPAIRVALIFSGYDELSDIPCEYHEMEEVLGDREREFWSDAYIMAYGNTTYENVEEWYQHLVVVLLTIKKEPELLDSEEDGAPLAEFIAVDKADKTFVTITIYKR